jgi:uncharacterized protein YdeI (YjbR/CyaY-like superfamily)
MRTSRRLAASREGRPPPSRSLSYAEALEAALCYGWIDGQKKRFDEDSWLQKFTPRGRRSVWSKRSTARRWSALIRSGGCGPRDSPPSRPPEEDGRWARAYDFRRAASVPDDLRRRSTPPGREGVLRHAERANRYGILYRIQTAVKPETRARRIAHFVEMLTRGETLFP